MTACSQAQGEEVRGLRKILWWTTQVVRQRILRSPHTSSPWAWDQASAVYYVSMCRITAWCAEKKKKKKNAKKIARKRLPARPQGAYVHSVAKAMGGKATTPQAS